LGQVGVEVGSPLLFVKRRQSVHGVRSRLWVSLGPTVFRHELLEPADRLVATYLHFLLFQDDLGLEPGDDATSTLLVMVFDDRRETLAVVFAGLGEHARLGVQRRECLKLRFRRRRYLTRRLG